MIIDEHLLNLADKTSSEIISMRNILQDLPEFRKLHATD